jgi:hypothetical protein
MCGETRQEVKTIQEGTDCTDPARSLDNHHRSTGSAEWGHGAITLLVEAAVLAHGGGGCVGVAPAVEGICSFQEGLS